jgi:hypothetical protein
MAANFPTGDEIKTYVQAMGFTVPAAIDMDAIAEQVKDWFESSTGHVPFIATRATRKFDPPGAAGLYSSPRGGGRYLRLDNGIVTLYSLSVSGTVYTVDNHFRLRPYNKAPRYGVEFYAPFIGPAACISIDADWGFSATLPDGAFNICLNRGAMFTASTLKHLISKGLIEEKIADTAKKWGADPLFGFIEGMKILTSHNALAPYTRKDVL